MRRLRLSAFALLLWPAQAWPGALESEAAFAGRSFDLTAVQRAAPAGEVLAAAGGSRSQAAAYAPRSVPLRPEPPAPPPPSGGGGPRHGLLRRVAAAAFTGAAAFAAIGLGMGAVVAAAMVAFSFGHGLLQSFGAVTEAAGAAGLASGAAALVGGAVFPLARRAAGAIRSFADRIRGAR